MRSLTISTLSVSRLKALALGLLVSAMAVMSLGAASAQASSITLYSNSLKSASGRAQIVKAGAGDCRRGGSRDALRFTAGKRTKACSFATPVVGRDLEVTVTGRIFKTVPSRLRESMFISANVRQARDGSQYQLAVFPTGRRFQIRKVLPDGRVRILKADRSVPSVRRFGEPNRVRLRAYNGVKGKPSSTARLVAVVNGRTLAVIDDPRGNELDGRDSGFSISTTRKAMAPGSSGSFSGVLIRIPNPF
jgi:hypothetical protein